MGPEPAAGMGEAQSGDGFLLSDARFAVRRRRIGDTMNAAFKFGLASALALATAAPTIAQPTYQPDYQYQRPSSDPAYSQPSYRESDQYQQDRQRYDQDRSDYQARKDAYDARKDAYDARRNNYEADRAGYEQARMAYEARRATWERERARYDARHGYGAYVRLYPMPIWDTGRWGPYDGPAPAYYPAPAAGYYGRNTAYVTGCRNDHSSRTAGAVIGGLAGAVLGSNLSAPGRHSENSVLGGVLGAVVGGAVGNAHDRYKCDARGPYYAYGDTIAYREDPNWRSGRYDYGYYTRARCRLAPAPVDAYGNDVRYVRVCPDADGRYRITG